MPEDPLSLMLARLDLTPSILSACELRKLPNDDIEHWEGQGILYPAKPTDSFACPDCGRLCHVQPEVDQPTKVVRGYVSCPECGLISLNLALLKRWAIDVPQLLIAIFSRAGATVSVSELVPGHLWRIGKANWCGRPRELLFARRWRCDDSFALTQVVKRRPKSLVFVPTERDAAYVASEFTNIIIALQSIVSTEGAAFGFDVAYVETKIAAAEATVGAPASPKPKRRGTRTASIEVLRKSLMEHLRAARDYAIATRDSKGAAELLTCPSKEELGKIAGLKPYTVTRCFKDKAGRELVVLWEMAHDLDRIIAYRK